MGIHISKKIEALTTPVKYRAYPNKKVTKLLNKSMAARRHIWNWMLGLQTQYYDAIYEYSKSQVDKDVLKKLLGVIQDSEDAKEVKKAKKEYNTLIKKVPVPVKTGIATFKKILPEAADAVINELIVNSKDKKTAMKTAAYLKRGKDKTLAYRMLDTIKLRKQIKFYKKQKGNEWLNYPNSDCLFNAARDLRAAWQSFFKDETNKRGKPKFRSFRDKQSFRIADCEVNITQNSIIIPKFKLKLKVEAHRDIGGVSKEITFERDKVGDFWAAVNFRQSYQYEIPDADTLTAENTLGIDMGIKDDFVILSTGKTYKNPKYLKKFQRRIAITQRSLSRCVSDSKRREKVIMNLNKLYRKLNRVREDFLHKVTDEISKDESFDCISVEDLNIAGMIRKNKPKKDENGKYLKNMQVVKRGFNKATADASMGSFLSMLEYKSKRNEKLFVKIGRFFASSKTCNACGHKKADLTVNEQYWTCPKCEVKHERNHNASWNIRDEGIKVAVKRQAEEIERQEKLKELKK